MITAEDATCATAHPDTRGKQAYIVAVWFFVVASGLGLLLRASAVWAVPGMTYGWVLHAHSHTAFLGWIYNAFFALAFRFFIAPEDARGFWRVFLVTQAAMIGMLLTFPLQGYARESILFSTMHMMCSGVFAWKLLRRNRANRLARRLLAAAFFFLFVSAAGPIALGPLAAAGLRDSPWYLFSIYVYLHFQYNGWFPCFLAAVLLQQGGKTGQGETTPVATHPAVLAVVAGVVLTLGVSALWMQPPAWVSWASAFGAILQLAGFWELGRSAFPRRAPAAWRTSRSIPRFLLMLAAVAFGLKLFLQALAPLPWFNGFVTHRLVAIAFLHLMFLVVVTPLLAALALNAGWLQAGRVFKATGTLFLAGIAVSQGTLAYVPLGAVLGGPAVEKLPEILFAGSVLLTLGALGAALSARWRCV